VGQDIIPINIQLGDLFRDVQLQNIFADSKTFVDCIALTDYETILAAYANEKEKLNFNLKSFVLKYFKLPSDENSSFKSDTSLNAEDHVEALWPVLTRKSDSFIKRSTLIPLPKPYIVPGGRFREVYYWDSYFTMLGLAENGKFGMIENMLDNFAYLIKKVGHIPNGNRTYYITRSQPPFFGQMVQLLAKYKGNSIYKKYKTALRAEYEFWMDGHISTNKPYKHCVPTSAGVMNRYFDSGTTPRQESFREDYEQVENISGDKKMYQDLRSGAESGWDFTSRWFADGKSIAHIITTDIIPVDLNALIYGMESLLTQCYKEDTAYVQLLEQRMNNRIRFLNEYAWNKKALIYEDYNWKIEKRTGAKSLAMVYPLYFKMADTTQAANTASYIEKHFLKSGGVVTTLYHSGQQWDAPNGWAPLQWITVVGLRNYGFNKLADTIATRWIALNEKVYNNTGKFVEKYNVEDLSLEAGGGEYPVQDGFGWSNGVYLALKNSMNK